MAGRKIPSYGHTTQNKDWNHNFSAKLNKVMVESYSIAVSIFEFTLVMLNIRARVSTVNIVTF